MDYLIGYFVGYFVAILPQDWREYSAEYRRGVIDGSNDYFDENPLYLVDIPERG